MVEAVVNMNNTAGLHARFDALLVRTAEKYASNIWLICNGKMANAKSIIGLMSLDNYSGTEIAIRAEGIDEKLALAELVKIIRSGFIEMGENSIP
jgi:phosphocarrier protein HPr